MAGPGDVLAKVQTDWWMRIPAIRLADAHAGARGSAGGTYMYEFAWASPGLGAVHALEVPFVFDTVDPDAPLFGPLLGPDPPQELARAMHAAWVSFATNGDPGWPRYDAAAGRRCGSTRRRNWFTTPGHGSGPCGTASADGHRVPIEPLGARRGDDLDPPPSPDTRCTPRDPRSGYAVAPVPKERQPVLDRLAGANRRFQVHALVELDVTEAASRIEAAVPRVSWTGFVIASVARAIASHPEVNTRKAGNHLLTFHRVDIGATVERHWQGRTVLDIVVVTDADHRSSAEITDMLRQAKYGPGQPHRVSGLAGQLGRLPGPLRRAAIRAAGPDPISPRPSVRRSASPRSGCSPTAGAGPSPSPP